MDMSERAVSSETGGGTDGARVRAFYRSRTIAQSYDRDRFSSLSGRTFNRLERAAFTRALDDARGATETPQVLDAPCGTGRVTEWLLELGCEVTAADISEAMLDVATRRCARVSPDVRFLCTDLESIALPDRSVDIATCIRLFHHLPAEDRVRILGELARVTRHAVIANLSLSTAYYRLRRGVKRLLRQGVSRQSCTYAELESEGRRAGLRIGGLHFVARYLSEDVIVVFRKAPENSTRT